MTTFKQFKTVFFTIFKNNFKRQKGFGEKKSQKIASLILIAFGILAIMSYFVFFTIIITRSLIQHGMHEKLLYLFIGFSQFIVLFFGAFAVMSYLYFSKDNQLLSSLPVSSRALFLAKFAMAYVSEIIIGALAVIPTVTTYGIVCIVSGIKLNAAFFILEILGIFIFPIAPLLLITLISLPLMYVVAFFRQRAVSNAIATALIIVLIMSIYFGLIGSFADMSQEMENGIIDISRQFSGVLNGAYYATIFNKPYIDAMLGKKIALNLVIYLVGITILMAINIILSSFFYKRGISVIIEGEGKTARRKVNKELVYTSSGLKYSLIKKEIKTLVNTPMMLVNSLMGVILGPILIIFTAKTGAYIMGDTDPRGYLYSIGFISYIVSVMVGASNQLAMVGISREGQSLFSLKALPLSPRMLVKIKLLLATSLNVITIFIVSIVYVAFVPGHNVLAALGIVVVTLSCGFGVNCMGIYNDLKNPNLTWHNPTELNRNNKKALKSALTIIGIGLFYLIAGSALSFQKAISVVWSYALFFGITLLVNTITIVVCYKKLFDNVEELWEKIEG